MGVVINNVCIKPIDYEIGIEFFGLDYTWCLNVEELKRYLATGILFCNYFVGDMKHE